MVTEEQIAENATLLREAYIALLNARLESIETKQEWERYMAVGLANGDIQGKNENERTGNAINANLDLYAKLIRTTTDALAAEGNLNIAKVSDKEIGRKLMLMSILAGGGVTANELTSDE